MLGLSSIGMWGSQWGYTIVNFVLLYIIGAWLRRDTDRTVFRKRWLPIILLLDIIIIEIWAIGNDIIGLSTERSAWEYCNPLVVFEAVLVFLIFKNIKMNSNKWINSFAKAAFTVYLLHTTLLGQINIEEFVKGNPLLMLLHLFITCNLIYVICWGVYCVYNKVMSPIFRFLGDHIRFWEINV